MRRPWWARLGVWLLVAAVMVVLGVLVSPKLYGFTFLFLPFVWMSRGARSEPRACPSCGAVLDESFDYCPRCGAAVR